jgi:hypothetical protein
MWTKTLRTELVLVRHISIAFGGSGGVEWALALGRYTGNTFGNLVTSWLLVPGQTFSGRRTMMLATRLAKANTGASR